MRKFQHIFLVFVLMVSQSPVSAFRHVAEAAEELPTYNNPMNGEAGANFTGAIKWLQDNNAFDTVQDVTVAILDDGVDISNPYIDENAFLKEESKSFIPGEEETELALKPPSYSDGHGTTMASVIGGKNGLGALSGVSGVNYISYRYYEYNYHNGERRGIVDSAFRSQLLAALNSLYTYATTDSRGSELKVALITGAMSRAVKMIVDETPNRIDTTKPRKTEMGDYSIYFYNEEIGFNDKDTESGFDDVIALDRELETAILRLHNAGVSVVVAENNLTSAYTPGADSTLSACPAFYDGALAVTAVNKKREIAAWPGQKEVRPDFTPNTDIAGYGSNENAADWWVAVSGANSTSSQVSKTSGTSIAAAQVAAAIALTAKARSVGLSDDWTGVDAEEVISGVRYPDSYNDFSEVQSVFNGAKGVINVFKAFKASGLMDGSVHYHTYDIDHWSFDEVGHWHTCIGENCDNRDNIKNFTAAEYAEHTFGSDNKCTVCGHERKTPEVPEADLDIDIPQPTQGDFKVLVNGEPVVQGTKVKEGDRISVSFSTTANRSTKNASLVNRIIINGIQVFSMKDYPNWNSFDDLASIVQQVRLSEICTLAEIDSMRTVNVVIELKSAAPVYRVYNKLTSEHMCVGLDEYNSWKVKYENHKDFWKPEGAVWYSSNLGVPVFRLYNRGLSLLGHSSHYYTSDTDLVKTLVSKYGWKNEGVICYSDGTKAIYHAYSEALGSAHLYTSSLSEYRGLDGGWNKEPGTNGFKDEQDIQVSVGTGMFRAIL